jgi:DNA (cytosine-5)-methyltransferase 1
MIADTKNIKPFKVLNLYACLGGNRYKWTDCEVTAVELDPELARMYQERFPNDKVIVADAHQYLLDHYKEFDFIWSSPPCPTHSRIRITQKSRDSFTPVFPDMKLYEEIIFLDNYFDGKYCVENVIPYYEPLIPAQKRGRHLYWTNFLLPNDLGGRKLKGVLCSMEDEHKELERFHELRVKADVGGYRDVLRNLVDYEVGLTIFNTARNIIDKSKTKQLDLFDYSTINNN